MDDERNLTETTLIYKPLNGYEGQECNLYFNCSFLMDGLDNLESDEVQFKTKGSSLPAILTGEADPVDYLYLLMPIDPKTAKF